MANTLNLGNGDWATKENSLLGYNSENGNYKPLAFDFTRASNGTFVNKSGLIETAANGVPRIDFLGNTSGALLLEPQRTNLIPYSSDFSNAAWAKQNVTVTSDSVISPDGTLNADKITDDSTNGAHRITDLITTSSSGSFTYSIFLKKGTLTTAQFQVFNSATASSANVDLVNGTITSGGQGVNHTIQDYGNDWFKCSISGTLSSTATTVYLYIKQKPSYIGNGDYLYAWGAQLEVGSYSTSLINTQGSAVTRVADVCTNGGNDQVINSTEGTLYFEGAALSDDGTNRRMSMSDGTSNNRIVLGFSTTTNQIIYIVVVNGVTVANGSYNTTDTTQFHKIAIKYKENDFALWANGVQINTDTSGITFPTNTLNVLQFTDGNGQGNKFFGKTKALAVYNTALTDAELIALTTI
jgi:hypothetical protein